MNLANNGFGPPQGTQLHKLVIQFCGWEAVRMEEV